MHRRYQLCFLLNGLSSPFFVRIRDKSHIFNKEDDKMKLPQVTLNLLKIALVSVLFVVAAPAQAGKLATPLLIANVAPQVDWGWTALVANLGRHTEAAHINCYDENGSTASIGIYSTLTLAPGTGNVVQFDFARQGFHAARCELEFQGSANDWRLSICNYDQKFQGLPGDQCIEGR
jgi:hypothetical protein